MSLCFFQFLGELCRVLSYIKTLLLPNSTAESSRVVAVFFLWAVVTLDLQGGEFGQNWGTAKTVGKNTRTPHRFH